MYPCARKLNSLQLKHPCLLHFELAHSCISFCPGYLSRVHRLEVLSVAPCPLSSLRTATLRLWPPRGHVLCLACPRHSPNMDQKVLNNNCNPKTLFVPCWEVIDTPIRSDKAERGSFNYAVEAIKLLLAYKTPFASRISISLAGIAGSSGWSLYRPRPHQERKF